ncbi:Gfo/Idh/MocA family protein [Aestuariivirga sp.]|uniref:Gfo/Idh/MocA family protein n=1 Tax=Aestuariivirga sp. TaxID=2650926 RepID=UPI0039E4D49A
MHSIRIIGAGSIGNHLANAARAHGWRVTLTDIDPAALERTKTSIYPQRYGAWDKEIVLKDSRDAMGDEADVVFVGTPPDSHIALANAVLDRVTPKVLLIEKPLAGPDLAGCAALNDRLKKAGVFGAVGYNHTLGKNTVAAEAVIASGKLGPIATISARTREHWGGIFKAHPWLPGPAASYLGFSSRGGGSAGEHSHGINIWQHFANLIGGGRVAEVQAMLDMVQENGTDYDRLCYISLKTDQGLVGDVIQDVVTQPAEKSCRIQGRDGYVNWLVGAKPGHDGIISGIGDQAEETLIAKTRADDFKAEIAHLEQVMAGKVKASPIALECGLDTMMVIAAAFKSHASGRRVRIDWSKGYTPEALQ